MTKKAAALLLAASLAVSVCATPAFAAVTSVDIIKPSTTEEYSCSGETKVTYKVNSSYEWSIPAKIDFGEDAGVDKTREVDAKLANDEHDSPVAAKTNIPGTATMVCILNNIISVNKTLTISLEPTAWYDDNEGSFFITTGRNNASTDGQKLYYTVKTTDAGATALNTTTNKKVVSAESGVKSVDKALIFELNTKNGATAEKAGTYNGYITFTATVADT